MYYTIWMYNPTDKQTNVQRVYKTDSAKKADGDNGKFEKLGVTNPWNCQQRILHNADIGSLVGSVESPSDWWRFSKGHRKPIAEVNYTAVYDPKKSGDLEWLNSRVRVETTVDIYQGSIESRSFDIPIRVIKPTGNKFFDEQVIDLGIITSSDVAHRYIFRIGNKHSRPAVVQNVSIDKNCKGMNIKFATPFAYKVPLPSEAEPFDFIWLFSHPDRKSSVGYCSGTIQIKIDVSGRLETYEIMYYAGYYKHMLADDEAMGFQLTRKTREGSRIINKFNANWKSRFPVDLIIQDVVFPKHSKINYKPQVKNRRVSPGLEVPIAFVAEVAHEETDFTNKYSNSNEFMLVNTLGTQVSILLRYYSLGLMCGLHNAITLSYEKCKPVEGIAFGYVAVGQRKVITMDILNPTMVNYIIKRVEFKEKNSDVEIVFENQSKTGMKSYYKKANRNLNTFFLIPKNEVVSIRIKVKPKYTGNFRDSVTIYFGKGEITLQVSYSGINGGLEFSPSPLTYDLFYPIESDEQQVSVVNNFNANIEITTAWSPQNFIFTNVYGSIVDAKSKTPFMGVTIDLSPDELMDSRRPNYLRPLHPKPLPALSDLIRHQDQAAGWERLVKDQQTEVTGEVIVQTELMADLKIPVKATLRKASLVPRDVLSLGPIEEQRLHTINVSLSNPTNRNVTMRFFLADAQMLDAESLKARVERRLKKRYAKFKDEIVCVMQKHLSEDDIRYFMDVIFGGVKHVPRLKSASQSHHCFTLNNSKSQGKKFFESKGNYLFDMRNISRFSRKRLMRDNDDIYYLKDVIRMSKRSPPTNPRSLFGLSFMDKLSVLYARLVSQLGHKLNPKKISKSKKKSYYLSSMREADFQKLLNNQEIFLNPKFRYRNITLAPQQQISLPILVCRPKEFSEIDKSKMSLLIKNDYSNLAIVPIQVSLGKIGLIVDKVITVSDDNRVIYPQSAEEYYQLVFNIHPNDIVQKLSNKNDSKRIVYKKGTRRLYELKNVGNLPIKVKEVIAGEGCSFSGFKITNCQGFELAPNHTHRLEIVLARPNNFEVDFRKQVKLILEGRVLTLDFRVQANPLATSDPNSGGFTLVELATKSFTDTASSAYRYIAVLFCGILAVLMLKHYQEKADFEPHISVTSLDHLRYRSEYFHDNILDINYLETTLKYKTLEAQKNKHIRNIGLKQLMTPSQQEIQSVDVSVHSENQEPEVAPPKKGKNHGNGQHIKVINNPTTLKGLVLAAPEPKLDPKKGRGDQRIQTPRTVQESRPPVPPVDMEVVHQQAPPAKSGKKKKQKRSEHLISELTSPRVDENLTHNILAQLDPPEATPPLVDLPVEDHQITKNRRKSTHEKVAVPSDPRRDEGGLISNGDPYEEPEQADDEGDVAPIVERVPEDSQTPADHQNQSIEPNDVEHGAVEPPRIERHEPKMRSRKHSAAQRHVGATPSNRGEAAGAKMDHSQASQTTSGRGGKKSTTPQNRGKHLRNRKQSRSDDEESEETFVPKHQVQSQPTGKDSKGRYQGRGAEHRNSSEESEPEYQVKHPQQSPRQVISGGTDERIPPKGSKESSLNAGREDPSVPAPRSRKGADTKTNSRLEKDPSPKRTKDKKKAEVVYYQRVEKSSRFDQDQASNETTPKTFEEGRLHQQNHAEADPEDADRPIYRTDRTRFTTKLDKGEEEMGSEPKEHLRKADASFLEEEGTQGQHFNQQMISFNNQDISAIDNLEDGASNTSQVFGTRDDIPSRDKLASRLNQKRYSHPRQDEDSEEEVGFVNRSRENIRKHMELDKNDKSHVDDSSLQEEDPINKRVGAIGGKKTKATAPKDKAKHAIGSGAHKNASLAGFRQAENNYQPFGGMASVFNGPRVMGSNNYGFGRLDPGYGQAMYDPYGGPPGYGQPAFRGGFAPPYYPQDPQNYYQSQPTLTHAYQKPAVRPGVKYYNHGFGAVLMRDSSPNDPSPTRTGFSGGNFRYDQTQKPQPGHGAPFDPEDENEDHSREAGYPYIPEDEEQYEQYTGYPPGVGLDDSFAGQKQFKPALNNPFTLSGLGNSQVAPQTGSSAGGYLGYPIDYDWNKAEMYGMTKGNDGSHHSQSMSSSSRNASQLRPPPGLVNEDENEVRERHTEELQEAKRDVHSNNETGRGLANSSIQQTGPTNKQRGTAKQQFNLFG